MRCMACFETITEGTQQCPCCGFVQYQVIGDTQEAISALELMASRHRSMFLRNYDLGITLYTWKDQNGTIVPDSTKRLSFGNAETLLGKTVWLDQQFARIPEPELTVELSVEKTGSDARTIPVRISVPQEKQLQRLGIQMQEDLSVRLLLKNEATQTESKAFSFLHD